ncbi:hypothetical protein F4802DRAFT_176194 [Xylaria palmicola]|nr:hypothetical protein F4802DRAFT_176194 [Xylaria palmicola]
MRPVLSVIRKLHTSALPHNRRLVQNTPLSTPHSHKAHANAFAGQAATNMTTITLKSPAISVSLPEGLSESQLLSFAPFNSWLETLTNSLSLQRRDPRHPFHGDPYALRSVAVQSYDVWGGRVGFLKLKARVTNAAGESLPGAVFLRGPSVAMLVMLLPDDAAARPRDGGDEDEDEDERYVLMTVQPRIPAGSLAFAELPAGMVDDDAGGSGGGGKFAGTAAREIYEELGIEIPASELVCLSELAAEGEGGGEGEGEEEGLPSAMYPSAGGCDEYIPIYMHERRVPRATLQEWTGKLTGLRDHGEKITLKLVPMRHLWREGRRDAKALAALALWEGLRREGKLQGKL